MAELDVRRNGSPDRLPTRYEPMAQAIAPRRRVLMSTDAGSVRALRSVGKVAATTDNVIHLDPQSTPASRLTEVVAHELTHVAHPSPAPRFFDDIDDSPEERRAEQVADIMARSPLAPSAGVAPGPDHTIRRTREPARSSTAGPRSPSAGGNTIDAAALAASLGSGPGTSQPIIRRATSGSGTAPHDRGETPHIVRRTIERIDDPTAALDEASMNPSPIDDGEFRRSLERNADWLITTIEDRVRRDLERRGRGLRGVL